MAELTYRDAVARGIAQEMARDPDVILTLSETIPAFALRAEWQVVDAVRERRFVRITGSAFSRPGPRSPGAVRELAAALREAGE